MGYLRFFLMVAVVHGHMVNGLWHHRLALLGFFAISGFLITRISCEVYNGTYGRIFFLINRFFRIYPMYLACLAIAACIIYIYPHRAHAINHAQQWPNSLHDWMMQFSIAGLTSFSGTRLDIRLLPTAWSLGVEIMYYLVIGLLTGRSARLTLLALILSLDSGIFFHGFYGFTTTAPVFFLGSLMYHMRKRIRLPFAHNKWLWLAFANITLYLPDMLGISHQHWAVMYVSMTCFSFCILSLYTMGVNKRISGLEQFLADISYPMFLLQWAVLVLLVARFHIPQHSGYGRFIPDFAATFIISTCLVYCIDVPGKSLRQWIRNRAKAETATNPHQLPQI